MQTPPRRRLRLLRRYAFYVLAVALVCVALVVGAISQLLPLAEQHPDKVAAWLSDRAGQPVRFDEVETAWTRRGPLLRLDGLHIGQGEGVRIGQAEVLVSLYAGLWPGSSFTELRLRGLSLTLERAEDGRWSVRGLPGGGGGDPLDTLRNLGELQVIDGRLTVDAPSLGIQNEVPRLDLRVRVDGPRLRAGARGWIDAAAPPLVATVDFDRQAGDGLAWVAAEPADLAAWSQLLQLAGVRVQAGKGDVRSWVQLRDHRVVAITTDADLRGVRLAGTPLEKGADAPLETLDTLQLRARWLHTAEGWRLDAPRLRLGWEGREQQLDGLLLAGGERFALAGEQLDLTPLLRVASLSDRLDAGTRRWLRRAQPQLRFSRVQVGGLRGGALRGSGELDEVAFAAVGGAPGLSGLRGHFEGDGEAVELTLRPDSTLAFDWPSGFGEVHEIHLAGRLVGWREGEGWRLGTPAMRVQGTNYAADLRGGVWFQGDGTRPWLDLAAELDDVPMVAAKRFWVRSKMSQAAIDWLDAALVDGQVRNGRGLVSGDLDDWPFDGNNGRFEASGHIDRGAIRFQQEWPVMEQVDADIAFIANGFSIRGKGDLAGVPVDRFEAGIPDFGESRLRVTADSRADAAQLLAMLRKSPLREDHADTFDNLVASGPTRVSFELQQPLHAEDGPGRLSGEVELRGARLVDKRWDLRTDAVRGIARYSEGGFAAPELAVRMNDHDGVLALRAGAHVEDPGNVFEARLSAMLDARTLLQRAPELSWLQPRIDGISRWTVGVDVPRTATGVAVEPPGKLRLRSDLVGTALLLPAPLDKPAGEALPTTVSASLPLGSGRVDVAFGQRLALAAQGRQGRTGVQVTLGDDEVDRPPLADGLVVTGRTGSLDALEWIGLARGAADGPESADSTDSTASSDSLALRHVDVQAAQLLLAGGMFADTRLQLRPRRDAVTVQLDGPSLAGELEVPNADGGTIVGKLDRVHWKMAPAAAALVGKPAAPGSEATDPAKVPPLSLVVDDLRFGTAHLGGAALRTRQLRDGLEVEQLQLRAPRQAIDITGHWRGTGAQASTRLHASVTSEDLGQLLQSLDYGGQLRGGQGTLELEARWPGGPGSFALAELQGSLALQARNGQLLEVEPGAGRVLGLLSVAQLPRRLMLDFRDFFSRGFAFNQIEGQVQFGQGTARTEGISIESPAADLLIRGQTDLRTQQFDQTIDVNPRSGNLLTVVGAVAGGPVGAAVGAAANAVLSKPLGGIGARTYHVTGPWKDPKVEVIERNTPAAPPPTSPRGKPVVSPPGANPDTLPSPVPGQA